MSTDLQCPRDHTIMEETIVEGTFLDECTQCGGRFFDHGEMFGALGLHADPSYWDRPEVKGAVREAPIHCPRCHGDMHLLELSHGEHKVEIDRCRQCRGVWLDAGEAEVVLEIGKGMEPVFAKEREAAQKELDAMGEVDFNPGLIAQFLALFKKKKE